MSKLYFWKQKLEKDIQLARPQDAIKLTEEMKEINEKMNEFDQIFKEEIVGRFIVNTNFEAFKIAGFNSSRLTIKLKWNSDEHGIMLDPE